MTDEGSLGLEYLKRMSEQRPLTEEDQANIKNLLKGTNVNGDRLLYGCDGDEILYDTPEEVYETYWDVEDDDPDFDRRPREIFEWDVHPPEYHLPTVDFVLEYISDWIADNGEVVDGVADAWDNACKSPEAVAAAEALLAVVADGVGQARMANNCLRTITVTWDENNNALLDGERMYVRTACPDKAACHHACGNTCFRVKTCGPLSGVYPNDEWPAWLR